MKEIDARGLACPTPVLLAKDAIEKEHANAVRIIVDNKASKENVCLFFESKNYETSVQQDGDDFHITGKGDAASVSSQTETCSCPTEKPKPGKSKIMIMTATDRIGHGDDELGLKLMANFLKTLKEMGSELWRLVFVNNGVKLAVEGSEVLPVLQELETGGTVILVCGTCLSHFNLLDKKQVGQTTNMLDIVTAMQMADKVINI
ncbi:MAG: sulfurtransferase-like selenium metabolism protein YedF [Desulfobacterales bacterium]|nr:sulfurtransferase-like selenium metabolism protein YedF [Desulfobacterales bacterium]